MQNKLISFLIAYTLILSVQAQTESTQGYKDFPLVLTVQFHSLTLPFRNLKSNFSHIGFGVGTEVSYNGKPNFTQQLSAVWYRNKTVGNGLLLYTQVAWRPEMRSEIYGEVKAGVGYLFSFRPVESFKQVNGDWISVGHKGKGMLTLPIGVSLGYTTNISGTNISPFISYQFLIVTDYNTSIPIVPETLIQVGSRIHLDN
jgi:hypothetical protein